MYIFSWYFAPPSSSTNSSARPRCLLALNTPSRLPPANAGATLPAVVPGIGTTAYLPFTAPCSTALRLKSPPMVIPALPPANAVTLCVPVRFAHCAGGQMSSLSRFAYCVTPALACSPVTVDFHLPPFSCASSPPLAQRKGSIA